MLYGATYTPVLSVGLYSLLFYISIYVVQYNLILQRDGPICRAISLQHLSGKINTEVRMFVTREESIL